MKNIKYISFSKVLVLFCLMIVCTKSYAQQDTTVTYTFNDTTITFNIQEVRDARNDRLNAY